MAPVTWGARARGESRCTAAGGDRLCGDLHGDVAGRGKQAARNSRGQTRRNCEGRSRRDCPMDTTLDSQIALRTRLRGANANACPDAGARIGDPRIMHGRHMHMLPRRELRPFRNTEARGGSGGGGRASSFHSAGPARRWGASAHTHLHRGRTIVAQTQAVHDRRPPLASIAIL